MVPPKDASASARKGKTMFAQLVSTIDSFLWGWPLIILLFGTHKFFVGMASDHPAVRNAYLYDDPHRFYPEGYL